MRNTFSALIASAVSALASTAAIPAHAHNVPEGQCLPRDQMIGRMRAEGQRVVVTAVAVADASVQPLSANVAYSFSANSSGSEGYELTTEDGGTVLCVRQHLTNIRIADPSRQQVSPFYMAGSVSDADARVAPCVLCANWRQRCALHRRSAGTENQLHLPGHGTRRDGHTPLHARYWLDGLWSWLGRKAGCLAALKCDRGRIQCRCRIASLC